MLDKTASLTPQDLAALERCFISAELAAQARLFRVSSSEGALLVGRNGRGDYSGIVFSNIWPGDDFIREYRLRRDKPDLEQRPDGTIKEKAKYLSPPSGRNLLYFMPGTKPEWLNNVNLPVAITEGEKKAVSLYSLSFHGTNERLPRFLPIGISGIWNWKGVIGKVEDQNGTRTDVKGPIPDLDRINWQGRPVYIIYDVNVRTNGSVRAARYALAKELRRRGAIVRFVDLPDVQGVNGIDDFLGLAGPNAGLELINNATEAFPDPRGNNQSSPSEKAWPEPQPLPNELLPVPVLCPQLLPTTLRNFLVDIAERMQCPLDYPTVGALVAAGMIIGNRLQIRPKALDSWSVVPNLWGAIVGPPGVHKSPALAEALGPLRARERLAREEFASALEQYQFDKQFSEAKLKSLRKQMEKAGANKMDFRRHYEEATIDEPLERRYVTNDPTTEKLGELLNKNPRGLLLFRDELTGWLRSLDRDGREQDRSFYLESWNGTGKYTYDRIGRGTLRIESMTVSILGGIQPARIRRYVSDALGGTGNDDGLIQRLQMLVYPDISRIWRNIDRPPDPLASGLAHRRFAWLDSFDADEIGASLYLSPEGSNYYYFHFEEKAQEFFDGWHTDLEISLRSGTFENPSFEAHMAKYRSLMPSLALIFHLLDHGGDTSVNGVTLDAAKRAAAWCSFLQAHARRVYALATSGHIGRAKSILKHIRRGDLPEHFTARDIYRRQWAELTKSEEVREALQFLVEYRWLRQVTLTPGESGGRSTFLYLAHRSLLSEKELS